MGCRTLLLLAAVPVLLGSNTAPPQSAVVQTRFDIDGDGVDDVIRIEDPPGVSLRIAGGREIWKPFATGANTLIGGTITTGSGPRFGNRAIIVATAVMAAPGPRGPNAKTAARRSNPNQRRVAMVLAWEGGKAVKIWEGEVGRQQGDTNYTVHVAATPLGLLRYQTRPDIQRCDGVPAHLYPEGYDFGSKRFRPLYNAPRLAADAPVLTASRRPPAQLGTGSGNGPAAVFRTRAASTQWGADNAGQLVPPRELDDGDLTTAWGEGLGGHGRGEFITATAVVLDTATVDTDVVAVRIVPGDAASRERFRRGNRLKRVGLVVGPSRSFWVEFPTDPARGGRFDAPYWVTLPEPVQARCVTLVLDSVYPGTAARSARTGDTAIAELAVLTDLDLQPDGPETALTAQVLAGGDAAQRAARVLVDRGARAVPALLAAAQAGGRTAAERLRVRRVLARIGAVAGAEQLAAGLAEAATPAADRNDFAKALAAMGADAVAPVAGLLADESQSVARRRIAASTLGAIADASARDALLAATGRGPRDLRREVALQLGRRAPTALPAILAAVAQADADSGREADLWRALGRLARRADVSGKHQVAAVMAERLATATEHELLYRLLVAAGQLDSEPVLAALAATLRRLPADSAPSNALRRVTASALAANPHPRARDLLVALLRAPDPGIRRRAVGALGERDDATGATDQALGDRLAADSWPAVRRLAAVALGRRCGAGNAAPTTALTSAVDSDANAEVRRASLAALVACRAPGIGPRLLAVAGNSQQPTTVRHKAITLIAAHGDTTLVPGLIALFETLRNRAWSSPNALRLTETAAVTLGRLGDRRAVGPLVRSAGDQAFPELQAAAIIGLAELCPPEAAPLFRRFSRSTQHAVAIAARNAQRRCQAGRRNPP